MSDFDNPQYELIKGVCHVCGTRLDDADECPICLTCAEQFWGLAAAVEDEHG